MQLKSQSEIPNPISVLHSVALAQLKMISVTFCHYLVLFKSYIRLGKLNTKYCLADVHIIFYRHHFLKHSYILCMSLWRARQFEYANGA